MEAVLDAQAVLRWCQAALAALADSREEIDALNVYPVPDGDTGTNLYLTMEAAAQAAEAAAARDGASAATVVSAAARGALLGARGNSGVILAQMLRGVAEAFAGQDPRADADTLGDAHKLGDAHTLGDALGRAATQGYDAVAEPVEGTMLTVARAAAEAAREALSAGRTLRGAALPAVALAAARGARDAVVRTTEQLDVLRRAGVVDAGGLGLSVILDAFDTVLTGRRRLPSIRQLAEHNVPEVRSPLPETTEHDGPAFEVMFLLDAADAEVEWLKSELAPLGDSLVVVGGDGLWNVHVHVDDAGRAVEAGIRAGAPRDVRITYLPEQVGHGGPRRAVTRAVVAFAAGDGLAALFESAGATVARTPVGHRPSTAEMLEAIRRPGAAEVVLLPNERDGVPVAEAAAAEARSDGMRVAVIPTHAQVQGLAALAVHEPGRHFDGDVVAMTTAAGHTRHGAVTVAAREAVTSAGVCKPGDILGVIEGDFEVIGATVVDVAITVASRMLSAGGELVTLVTGDGGSHDLADAVAAVVRAQRPDADTVIYAGGQPRYPLLIGVE